MRKGQVALYVLIGIIIVFGVVIAISLLSEKAKETGVDHFQTQGEEFAGDPELAAEVGRMQERVDRCLGQVTEEVAAEVAEEGVGSRAEFESMLEEDLQEAFVDCFYQFNTADKLTVNDEEMPEISVTVGDENIVVRAKYTAQGKYEESQYTLDNFNANPSTSIPNLLTGALTVSQQLKDPARYGTYKDFVSPDGGFNPNARLDQGIQAEMTIMSDGSCILTLVDWNTLDKDGEPTEVTVTIDDCALAGDAQ